MEPTEQSKRQRLAAFLSRSGEWLLLFSPALVFGLVWIVVQVTPIVLKLETEHEFFVILIGVTAAGIVNLQKLAHRRQLDAATAEMKARAEAHATELALLRQDSIGALKDLRKALLDSSINVEVRDHQELDDYLTERIAHAREARIVDGDPSRSELKLPRYFEQRDRLVKEGKLEHWRLVRVEDEADLKEVEELMRRHAADAPLFVACLDDQPNDVPPLVSMLILDEDEVHFGEGFLGPNPNLHIDDVGIVQRNVAANFTRYFERQWDKATLLKNRYGIHEDGLQVIRDRLARRYPIRLHQEDASTDFSALVSLTGQMHRVDIVSHPNLTVDHKARLAYYSSLGKAIVEMRLHHHRRIVWNEGHLAFLEHWLKQEPQLESCLGLEIRFLHVKPTEPFFHFDLLFDRRERQTIILYLAADDGESWVEVHDQKLAHLMQRDFEHLWKRAKEDPLKERTGSFDWDRLAELRHRLKAA